MPDVETCARLFWDRMAVRDFEREPLRVVRVAMLQTKAWRADVRFNAGPRTVAFPSTGRSVEFRDRESDRCEQLAQTGERLGIERVGLVVERSEVHP